MSPANRSSTPMHGLALLLAGAVLAAWAGMMSLALRQASLPPEADGVVWVTFPPGTSEADAFAAVVRAGGDPIRATWLGFVWVARGHGDGFVGRLENEGALAAFGELSLVPVLGGCGMVPMDDGLGLSTRAQRTQVPGPRTVDRPGEIG